ncbi:hypothetical protein D1BOALGB6SA_8567 [Olavius sp. associated proteobacterium Delta 1]|nr:hypothetical protein D1BOALGB6SA_8567 [Olavius sp. associated proteobacterium Delta 1]
MNKYFIFYLAVLFLFVAACSSQTDDTSGLFDRVAKLEIQRNDYTLGKRLTDKQKETAHRNAVEAASPGTYKFKDNDLYVVIDKATDRILIIYEHYASVTRGKIRELVGDLFFVFGEPTVFAHDKTIYWAYDADGKISEKKYKEAKDQKKVPNFLATVKLNSSHKIMDSTDPVKDGDVYYIISSEPLLKLMEQRDQ